MSSKRLATTKDAAILHALVRAAYALDDAERECQRVSEGDLKHPKLVTIPVDVGGWIAETGIPNVKFKLWEAIGCHIAETRCVALPNGK